MQADIARFIASALTKLDLPGIEGIDLKGVFSLADSVDKDLSTSEELAKQYLAVDPIVWMEAGGDPFWPVWFENIFPIIEGKHVTSNLVGLMLRPDRLGYNANDELLSYVLSDRSMDLIKQHMGIDCSLSLDKQWHQWSSRFDFINYLKLKTVNVIDLGSTEVLRKAHMLRSINALTLILEKNTQDLLLRNSKENDFLDSLSLSLNYFNPAAQLELFRSCVNTLGEDQGRSVARLIHSPDDGRGLSINFMLNETLARFFDTDPDKVMIQLRALDCSGLGDDYVSSWIYRKLNVNNYLNLFNKPVLAEDFWLDFVIENINRDELISSREWPAALLLRLNDSSFIVNEGNERLRDAKSKMEGFIKDNPACLELMIEQMLEEKDIENALKSITEPWPVSLEVKDTLKQKIVVCTADFMTINDINDDCLHVIANDFILNCDSEKSAPDVIQRIGEIIYNLMQKKTDNDYEFTPCFAVCIARYIDHEGTTPESKMSKCLKMKEWDITKQVIEKLDLPKSLYRQLNPHQRGDMLENSLGL